MSSMASLGHWAYVSESLHHRLGIWRPPGLNDYYMMSANCRALDREGVAAQHSPGRGGGRTEESVWAQDGISYVNSCSRVKCGCVIELCTDYSSH